jgi:hypothetical protein
MNKTGILKIAETAGISTSMVSITNRQGIIDIEIADFPPEVVKRNLESGERFKNTPEVDRLIRKYNRQSKKLIAALRQQGVSFWGRLRGSGSWDYTSRKPTYMDHLVRNNID